MQWSAAEMSNKVQNFVSDSSSILATLRMMSAKFNSTWFLQRLNLFSKPTQLMLLIQIPTLGLVFSVLRIIIPFHFCYCHPLIITTVYVVTAIFLCMNFNLVHREKNRIQVVLSKGLVVSFRSTSITVKFHVCVIGDNV